MSSLISTRLLQLVLPLLACGTCLFILVRNIDPQVWTDLPQQLRHIGAVNLAIALAATALSLWSVGRYDAVAHGHLHTGIDRRRARLSGTIAIALAQTLGFGAITGALARLRLLPDIGVTTAFRLSLFVTISFMAGLIYVTAIACLLLPSPGWTRTGALIIVASMPFIGIALFAFPHLQTGRGQIRLPSLAACGAILGWTLVDTGAAALALYMLLPQVAPGFAVFLPVFLIALTSGLISGAPAGVGPFDLALLTLLPQVPPAELLAALMTFRALYFAGPSLLAAMALLRPIRPGARMPDATGPALHTSARAEVGVIRQNGGYVCHFRDVGAALWDTDQSLTMLGDPIWGDASALPQNLADTARQRTRAACVYKAGARTALSARHAGWRVLHLADEAVVDSTTFDLSRPSCRQLRRKLRSAAKGSVRVAPFDGRCWHHLRTIDAAWQGMNGRARGGTMGQFCPRYLSGQKIFFAFQGTRAVAFVSFHRTRHEWCLDLMRACPDAPDGTMHALVHAAIMAARAAHVSRVSLAAVPACPDPGSAFWRRIAYQTAKAGGGAGLRRFKSSFAPRWQPLYAASPSWPGLTLSLADIARRVHFPAAPMNMSPPHELDDGNELASAKAA